MNSITETDFEPTTCVRPYPDQQLARLKRRLIIRTPILFMDTYFDFPRSHRLVIITTPISLN